MTKWILGIVAVAAVAFSAYHWQSQSTSTSSVSGADAIIEFVPADTIYYSGGKTSAELAALTAGYYLGGTPASQAKLLHSAIIASESADTPAKAFAHQLLSKFQQEQDGSLGSILDFFSLAPVGEMAIFSHGITPVAKLPVKDPKKLAALIDETSKSSGLNYVPLTLADKTVRTWSLDGKEKGQGFSVALYIDSHYATLTLLRDSDSEEIKKERLGITKPAQSLASSKEVSDIQKTYHFSELFTGFIHFERLATALLSPESSLLGKELRDLMSLNGKQDADLKVTPECAKEYSGLIKSVPRAVLGYEKLDIKNKQMDLAARAVLEIKSSFVTGELTKMRGHLSQHALAADLQLFGFAYGLNIDQLTPAITALWTNFTQQTFSCPQLVEMQQKVKELNPMMLGMFFGMAQGIKGVGMSVYDADFSAGPVPKKLSALISIAAENPTAIAALATMAPLPELASLSIPADGTPVALPLPMVPPSVELFAAIKGKHLVVYSGAEAAAEANKLTNEKIDPNGTMGMSINYDKLAKLLQNFDFSNMGGLGGNIETCVTQMEFADSLGNVSGQITSIFDNTDRGIEASTTGTLKVPNYPTHAISGKYQVESMNDYCQWQVIGTEQFQSNGTGKYEEKDFSGNCTLYAEDYQWSQRGVRLDVTPTKELRKESCGEEFSSVDVNDKSICFMSKISSEGFTCHFEPGTDDATLVRYKRAK